LGRSKNGNVRRPGKPVMKTKGHTSTQPSTSTISCRSGSGALMAGGCRGKNRHFPRKPSNDCVSDGRILKELRLATYNITSLSNESSGIMKEEQLCRTLRDGGIQVCAITGTKLLESSAKAAEARFNGYKPYLSIGYKPVAGVGFLVQSELDVRAGQFEVFGEKDPKNIPRIARISIRLEETHLNLVCVYAPDVQKDYKSFLVTLGKALDLWFPAYEEFILLGDFNAHLGCEVLGEGNGFTGKHMVSRAFRERKGLSDYELNRQGTWLYDFGTERGLRCMNTYFPHKEVHKYTYRTFSDDIKGWSRLDLFIATPNLAKSFLDVRARTKFEAETDHFLVEGRLSLKSGVPVKPIRRRKVGGGIKYRALDDCDTRQKYNDFAAEAFAKRPSNADPEQEWSYLKEAILDAATRACGTIRAGVERKATSWWTPAVAAAVRHKKFCYKRWLSDSSEENLLSYRQARNLSRQAVKLAREQDWESSLQSLQTDFVGVPYNRDFWKRIRGLRGGGSTECTKLSDKSGTVLTNRKEICGRWKEHFDELFNIEDTSSRAKANYCLPILAEPIDQAKANQDITALELAQVMRKQKAGKASGPDLIRPEFTKYLNEGNTEVLASLMNKCFQLGKVPIDWQIGVIVPIFKKGNALDTNNWRGITLLSVVGKLFARILERRIRTSAGNYIGEQQGGFCPGRSVVDQLFTLHRVIEEQQLRNEPVFAAFIDLEKAYDRVSRSRLFECLTEYGVQGKLLKAVQALYNVSRSYVRTGGEVSDSFDVRIGLRQGCVLSPLLFSIFIDRIMRVANLQGGVLYDFNKQEDYRINCLMFADDLVLLAESQQQLQANLTRFGLACEDSGMRISVPKTEVVVFARKHIPCHLTWKDAVIKQSRQFKYLGTIFTESGEKRTEILERVKKANSAVNALVMPIFGSKAVSRKAKLAIHKSVIRPILIFAHEVWNGCNNLLSMIRAVDMRCLRKILGVTMFDRIKNARICAELGVKDIVHVIKGSQCRWMGHVARMKNYRLAKLVHYGNIAKGWSCGRPRRTIAQNFKELLCVTTAVVQKRAVKLRGKNRKPFKVLLNKSKWHAIVDAALSRQDKVL